MPSKLESDCIVQLPKNSVREHKERVWWSAGIDMAFMRPVHSCEELSSSSMVPMRVFEVCCHIIVALTSSHRLQHHGTDEHTDLRAQQQKGVT